METSPAPPAPSPPPAALPPAPRQHRQTGPYLQVLGVGLVAVVVAAALDLWLGRPAATAQSAAAGVVAVGTVLALGIERVLQAFWTFVDQLARNPSTPFSGDATRLADFARQLGEIATPALDQAQVTLQELQDASVQAPTTAAEVQARLDALRSVVERISAGGDPAAAGGLATVRSELEALRQSFSAPGTQASLAAASSAVGDLGALLGSVVDDPGRRILSLFAGAVLGLAAAGVLGLDVVRAATGASEGPLPWGIVATGLAVGLGSNPLHELVQALQWFKLRSEAGAS